MFIENFPIPISERTESEHGDSIRVFPYQHIVFVSLTPRGTAPDRAKPCIFSAIYDSGHSHNFSISKNQLEARAHRTISEFPYAGEARVRNANGSEDFLDLYDGDIWLYPNTTGSQPIPIELDGGFTYYPAGGPPSYPLLGGRALQTAGFQVISNYKTLKFSMLPAQIPLFFGTFLVCNSCISNGQLLQGLASQVQDPQNHRPIGEILVQLGFLDSATLQAQLLKYQTLTRRSYVG